jgi:hypothetical protein
MKLEMELLAIDLKRVASYYRMMRAVFVVEKLLYKLDEVHKFSMNADKVVSSLKVYEQPFYSVTGLSFQFELFVQESSLLAFRLNIRSPELPSNQSAIQIIMDCDQATVLLAGGTNLGKTVFTSDKDTSASSVLQLMQTILDRLNQTSVGRVDSTTQL